MSAMIKISQALRDAVRPLRFELPVTHVYCPLEYAWEAHVQYLQRFASHSPRPVILLGMNPGPWGMAQTGVPFGEVSLVHDWLGLNATIGKPPNEHPKRPIEGWACRRSEVSGARLWGWAKERFGTPEQFFKTFFVVNYCPLVFMEESGKNRTPDKLPRQERQRVQDVCDTALRGIVEALQPTWVVGVGAFAEDRARQALLGVNVKCGRILHPSPASPKANAGWAVAAEKELQALGLLPRGAGLVG